MARDRQPPKRANTVPCGNERKVPGARHGLHLDHPETIGWIRQFIAARARPMQPVGAPNA